MSRPELNEKTRITLTPGILWSAVIACVVGTWLAAASFINIQNRLDNIGRDSLTHGEFQSWIDGLREQNPPLKVPAQPYHSRSSVAAVVARTETKSEE